MTRDAGFALESL